MFTVVLDAMWKVYQRALEAARQDFNQLVDRGMQSYTHDVRNHLVDDIRNSKLPLLALTPDYERRKVKQYGAKPILVASEEYIEAIVTVSDGVGVWRVGLNDGAHASNGIPYDRLATYLEFGTSRQAGRPHWRPSEEYARRKAPSVGAAILRGLWRLR